MRQATVTARAKSSPRNRERVKGDLVKPDYLIRLMTHLGPTAAARLIGVTAGTLHKGRNAGAVSKSLEVAARGVWLEKGYGDLVAPAEDPEPRTMALADAVHAPTSEATTLMLVQVPKAKASMLLKTAEMLGASVVVQD